jgi:hypothetical protein
VGSGAKFVVYPGPDIAQATAQNVLQVKETHLNPKWNSQDLPGGHDVGVVILAQPTAITPLPYNHAALTAGMMGAQVRLVGYGLTSASQPNTSGVKRQAPATLNSFDAVKFSVGDAQHETCNGDSGGPAFMTIGGVETIIGTTSYGDTNCMLGGFDMRVDAEVGFIDPFVVANDGSGAIGPDGGAPATTDGGAATAHVDGATPPGTPPSTATPTPANESNGAAPAAMAAPTTDGSGPSTLPAGCSVGGTAGRPGWILILALALVVVSRGRRLRAG